jgi:hypothetical protein
MCSRGVSQHDPDTLCTRIHDALDIGTAERWGIVITADLCQDQVRYLLDQPLVISVLIHNRKAPVLPGSVFPFDRVDLPNAAFVTFFRDLGRQKRTDDLFDLFK